MIIKKSVRTLHTQVTKLVELAKRSAFNSRQVLTKRRTVQCIYFGISSNCWLAPPPPVVVAVAVEAVEAADIVVPAAVGDYYCHIITFITINISALSLRFWQSLCIL